MFLSYVDTAFVGVTAYSKSSSEARPIEDVKGYMHFDPRSGQLCIRCEHVYLQIGPEIQEVWGRLFQSK